jgi:sugar lactone lactonase YvrE
MTGDPAIRVVGPARFDLGESPVWDEATGLLYWTDGLRGAIHAVTPQGEDAGRWQLPEAVGSFCLTTAGRILAACETGLVAHDPATGAQEWLYRLDRERSATRRLNDGKVAPDGSFVFGEMDRGEQAPIGAAFRFTRDGRVEALTSGFVVFNGPSWSPDGRRFYASDSGAGWMRRHAYTAGGPLGEPEPFASTDDPMTGSFDGSAMDDAGHVWSARVFGGRLTRFAPDGGIDREIALPVRKPTSLCFGGADLSTLFVTSMGAQLLPHFPPDGPLGGALFAITGLGVRGARIPRFAE